MLSDSGLSCVCNECAQSLLSACALTSAKSCITDHMATPHVCGQRLRAHCASPSACTERFRMLFQRSVPRLSGRAPCGWTRSLRRCCGQPPRPPLLPTPLPQSSPRRPRMHRPPRRRRWTRSLHASRSSAHSRQQPCSRRHQCRRSMVCARHSLLLWQPHVRSPHFQGLCVRPEWRASDVPGCAPSSLAALMHHRRL
jgi:hypothetical protein